MDAARIAAHPFLDGLPDHEVEAVARVASECRFETGDALASEGDFGHALFLIEEGDGEVSVDGKPVRTVGAGDVVGEVAVLSSGRRTASVVATSPIRALALFKRDVWALDRHAPEAAQRLRDALGERVR
jgi:CRP-like cAMP-binding protein